jgi:hypothetical protein
MSDYPGRFPVELWSLSVVVSLRVIDLVFCETLFSNKYILL